MTDFHCSKNKEASASFALISYTMAHGIKYFHSKQLFIEISLILQKKRLQEQVIALVEYDQHTSVMEKLKKLYYIHTDVEEPYYLIFKAIFETTNNYLMAKK